MAIALVTTILVIAVVLMVTEWISVDLTALGIMVALMVTDVLTPAEAVAGLANPAPVTVAVLFVVARGLVRTGALDFVTAKVLFYSRGSPRRFLLLSLFLVGGFSSFLNNTPVVILFISVTMTVCCEYSLSPSKFLLPISFVSILAGTATLIGTSTNIIVSDLAVTYGQAPIGMFELSVLGIPLAMGGALFLYLASPRLLPSHKEPICEVKGGEKHRYISELLIPEDSPLIGHDVAAELRRRFPDIELFQVLRNLEILEPDRKPVMLAAGDLLLVKATAPELAQILDNQCALLAQGDPAVLRPHDRSTVIAELLVQPNSEAVGRRLENLLAEFDADIRFIGVKRHWKHFDPENVRDLRLTVGDLLLVQAPVDHLDQLRAAGDLLVIEDVHQRIVNRKKAPLAIGLFLAMVVATAAAGLSILMTSMTVMVLMLLSGCLSLREAYRAIDGRVLILIVGTLSLGAALAKTGAADLYASGFLTLFEGASPAVVLSGFILLTSVLSLFLSNNATAVLLLPVAMSTAAGLGVDPRPFVIGICFGASACYASPIGYQTNLLVYGPGGYRFIDYIKLGLPLLLAVWAISSLAIPLLWPL